jgi:hypothetical protein
MAGIRMPPAMMDFHPCHTTIWLDFNEKWIYNEKRHFCVDHPYMNLLSLPKINPQQPEPR